MLKIRRCVQRTDIPFGLDAVAFNEFADGRSHAVILARIETNANIIQATTGGIVHVVQPDHVEVIVDGKTMDDLRKVLIPANGFDLVYG